MNWLSISICAIYMAQAVYSQGYVPQFLTVSQNCQNIFFGSKMNKFQHKFANIDFISTAAKT